MDIISSQAIFHMCPVEILLYEKQTFNYIIYNTSELYNTDKKRPKVKTHNIEMFPAPKTRDKKTTYIYYI